MFAILLLLFGSRCLADAAHLRSRLLQQASGPCVCAFDFDSTLRVGDGDTPGRDAAGVVNACKDAGYKVAIASANGNYNKLKKVLQSLDGNVFSDSFISSQAFQIGQGDKTRELNSIANYYGTTGACMVLFDDSEHNRQYADRSGAYFQNVDPSQGVTFGDYSAATQQVNSRCRCSGGAGATAASG